jgi:hypothetical protein
MEITTGTSSVRDIRIERIGMSTLPTSQLGFVLRSPTSSV